MEEFLTRKDLYRIVRREILFGLIPKTLKRIVSKFTASRAQNLRGGKWPVPLAAASKRATRKKKLNWQ